MGYLTDPIVAARPATQINKQAVALPADSLTVILATNTSRKGHLVRNTGTTPIRLDYGLMDTDGGAMETAYQILLNVGDPPYIHDLVEIFPYQGISIGGAGTLEITEIL